MPWPPRIGEPLPRAADAWCERSKLEWILGSRGHGPEWKRVFHVCSGDKAHVWTAIANAVLQARVMEVRKPPFGVTCGVEVGSVIDDRSALTLISWHYGAANAAPRLVTAYPIP